MAKNVFSSIVNKSGNISKMSNEVLHNRFILYFIFILAVGNLFHFVFSNDLMSVGVFIVSGLLTSFFSKNMVVIMVISMVVTNVIRVGGGTEGFESGGGIMENMQDALKAIDELEEMEGDEESDDEENDEEEEDDEGEEEEEEENRDDLRLAAAKLVEMDDDLEKYKKKVNTLKKKLLKVSLSLICIHHSANFIIFILTTCNLTVVLSFFPDITYNNE